MYPSDFVAILLVLAAAFSYLNYRFLRLPTTVGLTALTLLASLAAVAAGWSSPPSSAGGGLRRADRLQQAVLHGMLGFLLFAGALHIDLDDLARHKWTIALLATVGVVVSTLLVGGLLRAVSPRWASAARPIGTACCSAP